MVNFPVYKVLLIDDSVLIGRRVLSLLSTMPMVDLLPQATSAREGLKVCQEMEPDIVFLDINLPDDSGIELLKKLKRHRPQTRVIMLSNSSSELYRSICTGMGAEFFLDKTWDFHRIPSMIEQMIP